MENKEKVAKSLSEKITGNKKLLENLYLKRDNISRQIENLEVKIKNQEFAESHPAKSKVTKEEER